LRQENHEFEATLGYIVGSRFTQTTLKDSVSKKKERERKKEREKKFR
jgi:hypothetical protein